MSRLNNEFWSENTRTFWVYFPGILAGTLLVLGIGLCLKGYYWAGLITLSFLGMFKFHTVESTDPPKFALMKIWEKVARGIINPGRYLILPYFPFFQSLQEIDRLYQELTFKFKNIPCRLSKSEEERTGSNEEFILGGSFSAEIGLAIEPEPQKFLDFLLAGGLKPSKNNNPSTFTELQDLLWNNLVQSLRELGTENDYQAVVGMPREQVGIFLLNHLTNFAHFKEISDDEFDKLMKAEIPEELLKKVKKIYKKEVSQNPDHLEIEKWGINVTQFKVGPILPPKELLAEGRKVEEERKKREQEDEESETFNKMIRNILKESEDENEKPTMTYAEARKEARIQKELTPETINRVVIDGLDKPAEMLGKVIGALGGKSND